MVASPPRGPKNKGRLLSQILRALRRYRGKRPPQVALDMGMPQRSYEHFEAGKGRLNIDRIHKFAEVLEVDAYGILMALDIGSASFAVRVAGNKLPTVLLLALQAFDLKAQNTIVHLPAYVLMDAFNEMFDKLAAAAAAQDAAIKALGRKKPDDDSEDEPDG